MVSLRDALNRRYAYEAKVRAESTGRYCLPAAMLKISAFCAGKPFTIDELYARLPGKSKGEVGFIDSETFLAAVKEGSRVIEVPIRRVVMLSGFLSIQTNVPEDIRPKIVTSGSDNSPKKPYILVLAYRDPQGLLHPNHAVANVGDDHEIVIQTEVVGKVPVARIEF